MLTLIQTGQTRAQVLFSVMHFPSTPADTGASVVFCRGLPNNSCSYIGAYWGCGLNSTRSKDLGTTTNFPTPTTVSLGIRPGFPLRVTMSESLRLDLQEVRDPKHPLTVGFAPSAR